MFCPKCGYKNPDDARFCGKCGEMLPVIVETISDQNDELTQPTEIINEAVSEDKHETVNNGYVAERVSSRTTNMEKPPETVNQAIGTGSDDDTEGMNSNAVSWHVPPAGQGDFAAQNINSAARQNQYYIPPAEVLDEGTRQQENEDPENNTALIILIIVLVTLIILVGIFAFAYMKGILDI